MIKFWRYFFLINLIFIFGTMDIFANNQFYTLEKNVGQALRNSNYSGEYIDTTFRFGRRQEVNYQFSSDGKNQLYQVIIPYWRRGELIFNDQKQIIYYLPDQNSALKVKAKGNLIKYNFKIWDQWLKWITKSEGQTVLLGRETLVFSGKRRVRTFKLWVDKKTYLPLAIKIYHNSLLVRSITATHLEEKNTLINIKELIPDKVSWYQNEIKFWQKLSIPRIQKGIGFEIQQPQYLPAGYYFLEAKIQELSVATVVQLTYTNNHGEKFEIFERAVYSNQKQPNASQWKKITVTSGKKINLCQRIRGEIVLTLMGELSLTELKKVAASMQ